MTNATSSMLLIGFNGQYSSGPTIGSEPSTFVGFVASTTNANWFALVRNGGNRTTPVDTGFASTTNVTGLSAARRMRVEVTPSEARFLINGNVVARITTNIPSADLAPHMSIANAIKSGGLRMTPNVAKLGLSQIRVWVDDPPGEFSGESSPGSGSGEPAENYEWVNGADISTAYFADNGEEIGKSYGKLISIDDSATTTVKITDHAYDQKLMGVLTMSSQVTLGTQYKSTVRVATAGRVRVSVSDENGAIAVGDPITSGTIVGLGMKATRPGQIVGRALEAYDPLQPNTTCGFIDISMQHCQAEILIALSPSFNMNVSSMADVAFADLTDAMTYLASTTEATVGDLGAVVFGQITAKVAIVKDFFADKIFANRVETKELCVEDVCVTKAQFLNMVQAASAGAATGGTGSSGGSGSGDTGGGDAATSTPDTEAPVISVVGANPALISVGDTYSDLGATALDNGTYTLPVMASLDGGPQMDSELIQLDTSAAGEHTITYTSTDTSGNVSTATRTVIVNAPSFGGAEAGGEQGL
jgi:hypothetical protein